MSDSVWRPTIHPSCFATSAPRKSTRSTGKPSNLRLRGAVVRHVFARGTEMEKVTGIGGLFFRAHDPKALGHWYQQHLGVSLTPSSYGESA
jgi:hypothetical protein